MSDRIHRMHENWKRVRAAGAEMVDHPAHYGGEEDPYEHVKVAEAWGLDRSAHLYNCTKYICRLGKKGDRLEDLLKSRWYLDREIERERRDREGLAAIEKFAEVERETARAAPWCQVCGGLGYVVKKTWGGMEYRQICPEVNCAAKWRYWASCPAPQDMSGTPEDGGHHARQPEDLSEETIGEGCCRVCKNHRLLNADRRCLECYSTRPAQPLESPVEPAEAPAAPAAPAAAAEDPRSSVDLSRFTQEETDEIVRLVRDAIRRGLIAT